MDENAIHDWLIRCFGPVQGEMAWDQISRLPDAIKEQLLSQDPSTLPDPSQVQQMMAAFTAGGLNTMGDMQQAVESGPINVRLAKSLALQQASQGAQNSVSAAEAQSFRGALSEANLWLDTACAFDPAPGEPEVLTRAAWVEGTIDAWAKFAAPVAQSMSDALASVLSERLGGALGDGEIAGMFAGPVPIPIPEGMKDPVQLMKLLGNTSFAMQLGQAAGALSREVRGSFDQGIALLPNPAGGLIAQNVVAYAKSLNGEAPAAGESGETGHPIGFASAKAGAPVPEGAAGTLPVDGIGEAERIPQDEVTAFLALVEVTHARLFANVPWLMPRFEALIGKYARGIAIDLDAMEEQIRGAESMDPESLSDAVNLTKVAIPDTPEQQEALASLQNLLALVEGWVDCVVWRAGMAHIPHIEQLREMLRRERAVGGPAERTFESLLGMRLQPKRMREAAALWEMTGAAEGDEARDAKWAHPDLLPALPGAAKPKDSAPGAGPAAGDGAASGDAHPAGGTAAGANDATLSGDSSSIDWDAELAALLDAEHGDDEGDGDSDGGSDDAKDAPDSTDSPDSPNSPDSAD